MSKRFMSNRYKQYQKKGGEDFRIQIIYSQEKKIS